MSFTVAASSCARTAASTVGRHVRTRAACTMCCATCCAQLTPSCAPQWCRGRRHGMGKQTLVPVHQRGDEKRCHIGGVGALYRPAAYEGRWEEGERCAARSCQMLPRAIDAAGLPDPDPPRRHGPGKLVFANGIAYVGLFHRGHLNDLGRVVYGRCEGLLGAVGVAPHRRQVVTHPLPLRRHRQWRGEASAVQGQPTAAFPRAPRSGRAEEAGRGAAPQGRRCSGLHRQLPPRQAAGDAAHDRGPWHQLSSAARLSRGPETCPAPAPGAGRT